MSIFAKTSFRLAPLVAGGLFVLAGLTAASAQTAAAADFTKFGFPTVAATANFTPGTATSVAAGGHTVTIPANFLAKPVTFELLVGENQTFAGAATGKVVVTNFAFRVRAADGSLVATFDAPVQWNFSGSGVTPQSAVFDTTATTPPVVSPNSVSPGTVSGQTISHPFKIAAVGWTVLNGGTAAPAAPASGSGSLNSASGSGIDTMLLVGVLVLSIGTGAALAVRGKRSRAA